MSARPLTGRCMCGAVSFRIDGEPGESDACHCEQCRRQSGHYFASVNVPRAALQVTGAERITWYRMLPEMGPPETTSWEYPRGDQSWSIEFAEFVEDTGNWPR